MPLFSVCRFVVNLYQVLVGDSFDQSLMSKGDWDFRGRYGEVLFLWFQMKMVLPSMIKRERLLDIFLSLMSL